MQLKLSLFLLPLLSGILAAQSNQPADLQRILQRLDVLEQQNRELMTEIHSLREQIAASAAAPSTPPPAEAKAAEAPEITERIEVAEQRIRDLAQTTVQSDHHSAVQLTGMALFNTYLNGRYGAQQYPTAAAPQASARFDGAGFRQTILGLKFEAPQHVAGAEVTGAVYFDFFGGTGRTLDQDVRLRIANVEFNWKNTSLTFAQDKPILAPREPDSLAQVGISPLTDAGNLWLWRPQVRVEQRFHFSETSGLRAQAGIVATGESANLPAGYSSGAASARPAVEGRFVFWKQAGNKGNFEIAPGFHVSNSQLLGYSLPSRIVSVDWRVPLTQAFALTGTAFTGENLGVIGGLLQGIVVPYRGDPRAVHGSGGWAQLEYRATRRLSFHIFAGQEDDRHRDLQTGLIDKNQAYGGNAMYAFLANVVASFEASAVQTAYVGSSTRLNPHYDLALAYLF